MSAKQDNIEVLRLLLDRGAGIEATNIVSYIRCSSVFGSFHILFYLWHYFTDIWSYYLSCYNYCYHDYHLEKPVYVYLILLIFLRLLSWHGLGIPHLIIPFLPLLLSSILDFISINSTSLNNFVLFMTIFGFWIYQFHWN